MFLVVSVDHERQVADLIPSHQGTLAEENVPFSALEPYSEELGVRTIAYKKMGLAGRWGRGGLRRGRFTDGFLKELPAALTGGKRLQRVLQCGAAGCASVE